MFRSPTTRCRGSPTRRSIQARSITVIASGDCLVRGPVGRHRVHYTGLADGNTLDVTGRDRCAELDDTERVVSWSNMRASDAVMAIVATKGLVPDVEATSVLHSQLTHELVQHGTDLDFIRRLADRYGYYFWVTSTALGVDTADFKRAPVEAAPTATLNIHLSPSAFDELVVEWDAEQPTEVTAGGVDLSSLSTLDGSVAASPLSPMTANNLAQVASGIRTALVTAPGDAGAEIAAFGESVLAASELFVTCTGVTTMARAGTAIRAHTTVELDGLGDRYSGVWLVAEVRHLIDAVSHRMECTFVRNGWEGGAPFSLV